MITLGQASNYNFSRTMRHLFAWGTKNDFENLRKDLAKHYSVEVENTALYHTGRSALAAAIKAVAPAGGVKVFLPGLTCIAVVRAIKAAGCEPVFVDITSENLEYNYEKLEQEIQHFSQKNLDKNNNVCYNRGIILVQSTLGLSWNVSKIEKLAKKYDLEIVEDLAHSAGRFYTDGRETGTVGSAAALSFGKGKAIDTISGGAVIVRNSKPVQPERRPKLSDRLRDRWYPVFGGIARTLWSCKIGQIFIGGLVKIHWVQRSADAELDLDHRLTYWQAKLARRQLQNLPQTPLREYCLVKNRPEVLQELQKNGYCLEEIWYDTPVSPQRYEKEANFPAQKCPETVQIASEILNLPTWYAPEKLKKAYEIIDKVGKTAAHDTESAKKTTITSATTSTETNQKPSLENEVKA